MNEPSKSPAPRNPEILLAQVHELQELNRELDRNCKELQAARDRQRVRELEEAMAAVGQAFRQLQAIVSVLLDHTPNDCVDLPLPALDAAMRDTKRSVVIRPLDESTVRIALSSE